MAVERPDPIAVRIHGQVIHMPPELAAAIVAAQVAAGPVRRDGSSQQKGEDGKPIRYSSSDVISAAASAALNAHGAAWVRLGAELHPPALAGFDLGRQAYVGDVHTVWMIVHESGAAITGSSEMPIIASRGRPHDKATAASQTYESGGIMRGALCLERESKQSVEDRGDGDDGGTLEPSTPAKGRSAGGSGGLRKDSIGPRCRGDKWPGDLGTEISELQAQIAEAEGWDEATVFEKLLEYADIPIADYEAADTQAPKAARDLGTNHGKEVKFHAQSWMKQLSNG